MEEQWITLLNMQFAVKEQDIRAYSPLTLAYIGDAIYDLLVRTVLVEKHPMQVRKLHKRASSLVKAATQASMAEYLLEAGILSQEEIAVYKRGRNADSPTRAKNATIIDYRKATGFEALIGYLYLRKESLRMVELVKHGLEGIGETL